MTAAMTGESQAHPVTGQPVGLPVDTHAGTAARDR